MTEKHAFGKWCKEQRSKSRITLRDFCLTSGQDPFYWSYMEAGMIPAPKSIDELIFDCLGVGDEKEIQRAKQFARESQSVQMISLDDFIKSMTPAMPFPNMTPEETLEAARELAVTNYNLLLEHVENSNR